VLKNIANKQQNNTNMGFYSSSIVSTINWVEAFELFDKNKDGFIDERDLYAILNGLG